MRAWVLAAVAMGLSGTARADPKAPPGTEDVCVSVAHIWTGLPADVAHIVDVPVPASFRAELAKTGCSRFQLVDESLIDWHLRFGTEASTTAALAFLAGEYARRTDLDGAKPDRWGQLAMMTVRAAELYRSPALLTLSDRYLAHAPDAPPGGLVDIGKERRARLDLRRLALRALLTGSSEDVAAARELLRIRSTPALVALRNASSRREICDVDPADPALAPVREICGSASDFERDALDFWEASARIALAEAAGETCAGWRELEPVRTAVALLTSRLDPDEPRRSWPDYVPERIVALLLSLAEQAASPACQRRDEAWAARQALLRAERQAPVAVAPPQFRMIADRYLALPDEPGDRSAAALRVVVAHLDEITAGTKSPSVR